MANGDTAASVGYDVVAGSDDIRNGYDEINLTRDYLAQHRLSGTHPYTAITGLQNQLNLKLNANQIGGGFRDVLFTDGDGAFFHDQDWTPTVVVASARRFESPIILTTSLNAPTADSVGLNAWTITGTPYNGVLTIDFIAWRG